MEHIPYSCSRSRFVRLVDEETRLFNEKCFEFAMANSEPSIVVKVRSVCQALHWSDMQGEDIVDALFGLLAEESALSGHRPSLLFDRLFVLHYALNEARRLKKIRIGCFDAYHRVRAARCGPDGVAL